MSAQFMRRSIRISVRLTEEEHRLQMCIRDSRYTMDAKDSAARKYIAQRADFLGAIRLPNNAFKANAGTEVVSDIIFLQKRDRPIEIEPDWVCLLYTSSSVLNIWSADFFKQITEGLTAV